MRLLLDSHALLWWLIDDDRFSDEALALVDDAMNEVVVSLATVWELEIKQARGRIELPDEYLDVVEDEGIEVIAITRDDIRSAASLPLHHGDPFDRMLVAQAQRRGCTLVTVDQQLAAYGVPTVSAR